MKRTILAAILALALQQGYGQVKLNAFDFLIGNWQGVESGVAGKGIGFRTYQYELGNHFIFVENMSTFPKSEEKPLGEVHRDFGVVSYNSNTQKIVLREFHVEGFANIYELDVEESSPSQFVFLTREIENNPGNWKAKLILTKNTEQQFTEEFFIAMDGENYRPFLKNEWTKVK